ncbi:MAG: hypothetical protein Q9200_004609 [Gallowayella weberi]
MADDDSDYDFDADRGEENVTQHASATDEPLDVTRYEQLITDARRFYNNMNPPFTQRWPRNMLREPKKVVIAPEDDSPPDLRDDLRIGLLIPRAWNYNFFYWSLDHESERHIMKGKPGGGYRGRGATYRRCLGFSRGKGIYEDRVLAYTTPHQRSSPTPNANLGELSKSASSSVLSSLDDAVLKAELSTQGIGSHVGGRPMQMAPRQDSGQLNLHSSVPGNSNGVEVRLGLSTRNPSITSITSISSSSSGPDEEHDSDPIPPHFMDQTPFQKRPVSMVMVNKSPRDSRSDGRTYPRKRTRLSTAPQPNPLLKPPRKSSRRKNSGQLTTTQLTPPPNPSTKLPSNNSKTLLPPSGTKDSIHIFQSTMQLRSHSKRKHAESHTNTQPSTTNDSQNPLPTTDITDIGSPSLPSTTYLVTTRSEMEKRKDQLRRELADLVREEIRYIEGRERRLMDESGV